MGFLLVQVDLMKGMSTVSRKVKERNNHRREKGGWSMIRGMDTAVEKSQEAERCCNGREVRRSHEDPEAEEDPGAERENREEKDQDLKAGKGTDEIPILTKETEMDIIRDLETEKAIAQNHLSITFQGLANTRRDQIKRDHSKNQIILQYTNRSMCKILHIRFQMNVKVVVRDITNNKVKILHV